MRFIRPRRGFRAIAMVLAAFVCGTSFTAFAASNPASATLRIRVNVVPTINQAVHEPQKADAAINFTGFGPSAVVNSVEIRPLPLQLMRDIQLKTNDPGAITRPAVLQTTTIVLQ